MTESKQHQWVDMGLEDYERTRKFECFDCRQVAYGNPLSGSPPLVWQKDACPGVAKEVFKAKEEKKPDLPSYYRPQQGYLEHHQLAALQSIADSLMKIVAMMKEKR